MLDPGGSDKSRGVALGLACLVGVLGVHRFYVGKFGTGVLMFLTGGGCAVWWILDLVSIATGSFRDREERLLLQWGVEPQPLHPRLPEVASELDAINDELDEMSERLERAERRIERSQ